MYGFIPVTCPLELIYFHILYFYEPVELHVIIQTPYAIKGKRPLTFQKGLSMMYVFLGADPLGGELSSHQCAVETKQKAADHN